MPARSDFNVCRFFSMRLRTELTRPAPCPFTVGDTTANAETIKATIRPEETNLFISAPCLNLLSPRGRKKPRNYRERLSYVNLETADPAVIVQQFPDLNYFHFLPSGQFLYALLDLTLISLIANNFTAQKHPGGNWALMPIIYGSFAARKPAFWCQKDKD